MGRPHMLLLKGILLGDVEGKILDQKVNIAEINSLSTNSELHPVFPAVRLYPENMSPTWQLVYELDTRLVIKR